MIPDAYELKRILRTQRARFWSSDLLAAAEFAPIYFFDDQAAFDSDVVDQAMTRVLSGPIRLPHPAVIFELREQRSAPSGLVVCARQDGDVVEAVFLMRRRAPRGWTDRLVRAWLHPDGMAEIEGNPTEHEDHERSPVSRRYLDQRCGRTDHRAEQKSDFVQKYAPVRTT